MMDKKYRRGVRTIPNVQYHWPTPVKVSLNAEDDPELPYKITSQPLPGRQGGDRQVRLEPDMPDVPVTPLTRVMERGMQSPRTPIAPERLAPTQSIPIPVETSTQPIITSDVVQEIANQVASQIQSQSRVPVTPTTSTTAAIRQESTAATAPATAPVTRNITTPQPPAVPSGQRSIGTSEKIHPSTRPSGIPRPLPPGKHARPQADPPAVESGPRASSIPKPTRKIMTQAQQIPQSLAATTTSSGPPLVAEPPARRVDPFPPTHPPPPDPDPPFPGPPPGPHPGPPPGPQPGRDPVGPIVSGPRAGPVEKIQGSGTMEEEEGERQLIEEASLRPNPRMGAPQVVPRSTERLIRRGPQFTIGDTTAPTGPAIEAEEDIEPAFQPPFIHEPEPGADLGAAFRPSNNLIDIPVARPSAEEGPIFTSFLDDQHRHMLAMREEERIRDMLRKRTEEELPNLYRPNLIIPQHRNEAINRTAGPVAPTLSEIIRAPVDKRYHHVQYRITTNGAHKLLTTMWYPGRGVDEIEGVPMDLPTLDEAVRLIKRTYHDVTRRENQSILDSYPISHNIVPEKLVEEILPMPNPMDIPADIRDQRIAQQQQIREDVLSRLQRLAPSIQHTMLHTNDVVGRQSIQELKSQMAQAHSRDSIPEFSRVIQNMIHYVDLHMLGQNAMQEQLRDLAMQLNLHPGIEITADIRNEIIAATDNILYYHLRGNMIMKDLQLTYGGFREALEPTPSTPAPVQLPQLLPPPQTEEERFRQLQVSDDQGLNLGATFQRHVDMPDEPMTEPPFPDQPIISPEPIIQSVPPQPPRRLPPQITPEEERIAAESAQRREQDRLFFERQRSMRAQQERQQGQSILQVPTISEERSTTDVEPTVSRQSAETRHIDMEALFRRSRQAYQREIESKLLGKMDKFTGYRQSNLNAAGRIAMGQDKNPATKRKALELVIEKNDNYFLPKEQVRDIPRRNLATSLHDNGVYVPDIETGGPQFNPISTVSVIAKNLAPVAAVGLQGSRQILRGINGIAWQAPVVVDALQNATVGGIKEIVSQMNNSYAQLSALSNNLILSAKQLQNIQLPEAMRNISPNSVGETIRKIYERQMNNLALLEAEFGKSISANLPSTTIKLPKQKSNIAEQRQQIESDIAAQEAKVSLLVASQHDIFKDLIRLVNEDAIVDVHATNTGYTKLLDLLNTLQDNLAHGHAMWNPDDTARVTLLHDTFLDAWKDIATPDPTSRLANNLIGTIMAAFSADSQQAAKSVNFYNNVLREAFSASQVRAGPTAIQSEAEAIRSRQSKRGIGEVEGGEQVGQPHAKRRGITTVPQS